MKSKTKEHVAIPTEHVQDMTRYHVKDTTALERDTLLHIFRGLDQDADDRVSIDDFLRNFESMEVKPKLKDLEAIYSEHANIWDGPDKLMDFEGFTNMFPEFQILFEKFGDMSRESLSLAFKEKVTVTKDPSAPAK
jgi:hypothetical protein